MTQVAVSNNRSQAKEFNTSDVLINNASRNTQSSKQDLSSECNYPLFIVELGMQIYNFAKRVEDGTLEPIKTLDTPAPNYILNTFFQICRLL